MPIRILLLPTLLAGAFAAAAHAAPPATPSAACTRPATDNHLAADATQTGVISLDFYNAEGARVVFYECIDGRPRRLGSARVDPDPKTNPPTLLKDAVTWSCDRLVRHFAAVVTLPDGSIASGAYSVRTRSCAQRFELRVPRRVAPGRMVRVRVVDRWGIGDIRPRLCVAAPDAAAACRTVALPRAVAVATREFRATSRGRWSVELRVRRYRTRALVRAGGGRIAAEVRPPTVLATGDSTMQGIDSFLSDELGDGAIVRSDVEPGSMISRGHYWTRHARAQTERLHQRVTVISVGAASDGFPLTAADGTEAACCDAPWVLAYGERVREMMRRYLRGGRARVFWLTPPLPRAQPRAVIAAAIDEAIVEAAAGLSGVTVVRVDRFFAPHGYTDTIRYRGREVRVRETDGIHLNISGTAIVASILAPAIRDALAQTA
ncbi:MAG: uncharacterized protein QOJ35_3677 [Solirubrobacteraceae bacterium]|nr:uncharacterized protein [Solirubrobacteraceae bacterium]